ncbi:uncharacterized protein PV07_11549 [Cladophialophora immunda]|uniref:Uncharacterized protein n=1 Tax=Cladophialophora immunda TaxID=569365 RepID=A0A0D1Z6T8_9EURO|nr:uncharacterized protein PV07_11549 [Cladophialophora immunda]KIW23341.1 hypothetical protein PV07_11549 [Cladophialophora immunda]OQV07023.1 hypothetical protein CLAIMM_11516 [Cladophialophora immunda]
MSTLRLVLKLARADPIADLVPDQGIGLQFTLPPVPFNDSITEPEHIDTSLEARQTTGLASWMAHWYPPPQCSDSACTVTSEDDLPHIQINGDGFTPGGLVFGGIYNWPANTLSWGGNANAQS